MGKIQTYRRGIGAFIGSEKGQRFFNFAYSIGAAIVIWGALFKILHLPGGNELLSIGMGTEVLMFLLTAFDRPPKEYEWEKVYPALGDNSTDAAEAGSDRSAGHVVSAAQARRAVGIPDNIDLSEADSRSLSDSISKMAAAADQLSRMAELTEATQKYLDGIGAIAQDMERLHATTAALNEVSATLLGSYRAITENSAAISASSEGYVAQMTDLHRNISGLNTIYELQLRSVSSQIDSIDRGTIHAAAELSVRENADCHDRESLSACRTASRPRRCACEHRPYRAHTARATRRERSRAGNSLTPGL